jgi:cell pole-organizing protein PopZ
MSEPNAQEPTMEEILASIRRIISEDEPPADTPVAPPAALAEPEPETEPTPFAALPDIEAEDVLELTERVQEPGAGVESLGDLDVYPADAAPAPLAPLPPLAPGEHLVSPPIAESTASVFGQLAQRIVMPKEGRTLEDLVREMLNPLLKAWLDQYLPEIVQSKVDEEVERIARRHVG